MYYECEWELTSPTFIDNMYLQSHDFTRVPSIPSFPASINVLYKLKSSNLKPLFCNSTLHSQTLIMKTLEEADVGISCYISQLPGFRGILKQRYADFIVNEVDLEGKVAHLTCLDAPQEEGKKEEEKKIEKEDEAKMGSYTAEIELFRALAGDPNAELLKEFLENIGGSAREDVQPIVLLPDSDKSHRTAVHNFFKEHFKFLVTDVVDGPEEMSKCIRVRLNSGNGNGKNSRKRKDRGGKPFDSRGCIDWPENVGKYLRFHLYKENKDTQEALGLIGKMLGIQQRSFGFAGTKDKRAVTTQRVTVFKQQAKRLAALNDRLIAIKVGDFCYVKEVLLLGQLQGNRFTITLRYVVHSIYPLRGVIVDSEDTIKAAANSLGKNGFVNYFGLQRFGSGAVPTHLVGAALLRGEWKTVVDMILDPREGERESVREARDYYKESCDIDGTLRRLPRYLVAERAILQCLKKCPGNYLQALKAIPRTLRMMYVHSYQSYLWNHATSIRVQKQGGSKVMLGDLVYCKGVQTETLSSAVHVECEDDDRLGTDDPTNLDEIPNIEIPEEKGNIVKVLNSEDLLTGDYTIEDVVLPLPGSRVLYPMNDIAEIYHDLAKKDAISLTECVHNAKEFSITSLTGGYRRVFQKPIDFEWQLLHYTDGNVPLAETDWDIIMKPRPVNVIEENNCEIVSIDRGKSLGNLDGTTLTAKTEADDEEEVGTPEVNLICGSDAQSSQMALKLCFTLPTSCYATMAIRELLKTSTSVAFHKTLK